MTCGETVYDDTFSRFNTGLLKRKTDTRADGQTITRRKLEISCVLLT